MKAPTARPISAPSESTGLGLGELVLVATDEVVGIAAELVIIIAPVLVRVEKVVEAGNPLGMLPTPSPPVPVPICDAVKVCVLSHASQALTAKDPSDRSCVSGH